MLAPTAENDRRRRELVLVSDFQRTAWAKANFAPLPADTHIQLESTAPPEPLANLAILRVDGHAAGAEGSVQLDVEVGNYSPSTRKVAVEVTLGNSAWRLAGTCPPGRRTTLKEEIGVRRPGWQTGEARLLGVDDALAADNVCPFALLVRPQPTYVLLTRQRRAASHVEPVPRMCPGAGRCEGTATATVESPRQGRSHGSRRAGNPTLAAGDLIVLDHPGKLSRRDGQTAGDAAPPWPADRIRGRRTGRRHESQAAEPRRRAAALQMPRRVYSAAGRPRRGATSVPHLGTATRARCLASLATI